MPRTESVIPPKPGPSWVSVAGVVAVTVLSGVSLAAFAAHRTPPGPRLAASSASPRAPSASPAALPAPAEGPSQIYLSIPSASVVWALVDYSSLYSSADAGSTWVQRPMPTDFGVRPSISFIDDHEGWLLAPGSPTTQCEAAGAQVWHTTDAGKTWRSLPANGIASKQCKEFVYFSDPQHGFVTAWDPNNSPTVYATADGGATWRAATVPDNPIFATSAGGFALRVDWIKTFGGVTYLEATGTQHDPTWPRDFVYASANGGASWTWKQKVPSHELVLVTEQRWLEIDAPGRLDESTNGGQAMSPFQSNLNIDPSAAPGQILFGDERVGYVSRGATLQRTMDGGTQWTSLELPGPQGAAIPSPSPNPSLVPIPTDVELSTPSADVVWALVDSGRLFLSTDRGATWRERPWAPYMGGGGNPVISFVDGSNGWALFPGVPSTQCQQAGAQLWRTSDEGGHWSLVAEVSNQKQSNTGLPFAQCKEYVAFVDARDGYVAGYDTEFEPTISRTTDGGVHWSLAVLPDPPAFTRGGGNTLSVITIRKFGAQLLAAAVTPTGAQYVYRSTDGGVSWTYLAFVGTDAYVHLTLVTASRWLVIANDGVGEETTDAGVSWHYFSCDYRDTAGVASTFAFADPNVGYGTVRGGIQVTIDGGIHWVRLQTPAT